jgi:CheY-like chemotaxis protein
MSDEQPCILVVEDDEAAARLVELSLRRTRARVVLQTRAFGVLEAIAAARPAVVLMDVMMPGLDGPSLVELVREDPELASTRVVLWSALDRGELERRGKACGADGVIEKVAGPKALVDQLESWLRVWSGVELR